MKYLIRSLFLFFLALGLPFQHAFGQKEAIQSLLEKVNLDSLKHTVAHLTGFDSVVINGQKRAINSRYRNQPGNDWAATYLSLRLSAYGYDPLNNYFDALGRNIYAIKEGTKFPNEAFVICAHYDAIAVPFEQAVGADDNASGCAAVMEAARLLSDINLAYSVIFIFFDEEEQGMIGSYAFNNSFDFSQYSIKGVINIDMIGYDDNRDFKAEVHAKPFVNSVDLAYRMASINDTFLIGLDLIVKENGTSASDHSPFWENNISAVLLIEDRLDFNRYYHTKFDSMQYFHDSFFFRNASLAIATLSWFAGHEEDLLSSKSLTQPVMNVFPNPSNGNVLIEVPEEGTLYVYGMDGKLLATKYLFVGNNQLIIPSSRFGNHVILRFQTAFQSYLPKILYLQK